MDGCDLSSGKQTGVLYESCTDDHLEPRHRSGHDYRCAHACCEAENAHHPDSLSIPSIRRYIHESAHEPAGHRGPNEPQGGCALTAIGGRPDEAS
jgi:hypothetical protein